MSLKLLKPTLTFKQLNQIQALIIKNPQPHITNPVLKLLTQSSTPQNAFLLYNQMLHNPTLYNHYTFTHVLKACSLSQAHHKGLETHALVIKNGHLNDLFIQNSLLHFYVTSNDIFSAQQIFYSILNPDVVSWTTIISGLSKCGFQKEAIDMFADMNVKPNCTALVSVLSACSGLRLLKFGKSVHGYCLRNLREEDNIILNNAVLDLYVKCGSLENAHYLFVKMCKRDVVSWTTMIDGYTQRGFCEEAVRVFQEMLQTEEAEPNEATLVNVLSACSSMSAMSLGQYVHSYVRTRHDLRASNLVGNALINMYVKCGDVGMAIQVFNMLTYKDIISWSTIISGLAMNGYGKQVLQVFGLMFVNGVPPDDVTFIGLLSACSHGGLVDQGLMVFKAMGSVYQIVPQLQHYTCVVDMYGRAGLLEEAEAFIREMPPIVDDDDGSIWGALLNACRTHGNEKMSEQVRLELLHARGVSVGTIALMSNTYTGARRWEDANNVRDEMRNMGLKKKAGCSWIEVM